MMIKSDTDPKNQRASLRAFIEGMQNIMKNENCRAWLAEEALVKKRGKRKVRVPFEWVLNQYTAYLLFTVCRAVNFIFVCCRRYLGLNESIN